MNVHSKGLAPVLSSSSAAASETADARTGEILAAARQAFAEKGFDGASMQDLARAAGMSVGNFYRYFPSKAAIVQALIALDIEDMARDFEPVFASDDPIEAMRQQVRVRLVQHQCNHDGALWAEITATALRKPEIGLACGLMETTIAGYLIQAFAAATGFSLEQARTRFAAHAALMVMLVKSSAMMPQKDEQLRHDLNAMILRIIDQTLDEIAASGAKG
ncbi:TetR family transcriptional regulator [Cypionkella aquatica]|uniref:TetR family transcriptional regulator n=1 Tax=Cypionkella aquatica TaxID=1756042 RepID=A0AA37X3N9_9RHOB|nr:TetR/AcrR family transcriptional regulator [Cypionkella aquatica]GLS87379.1 TetR family transcriptional regulator [Cypionkella aquatica]GLS88565.1 TetR family transcriptional regulator [Cypionkella aquatica]